MDVLDDITDFIFLRDTPEKADAIFIPGSASPAPMERACRLWQEGYAPLLIPSGRFSVTMGYFGGAGTKAGLYPGPYETEAAFYTDIAAKQGVPANRVWPEARATYTMQNAVFSRELTDARGLAVKKALLCCKNQHARRALMYYSYAYPETEWRVIPVESNGLSRDNWFLSEEGIQQVLGELERCGGQFAALLPELARRRAPAAQGESNTTQTG